MRFSMRGARRVRSTPRDVSAVAVAVLMLAGTACPLSSETPGEDAKTADSSAVQTDQVHKAQGANPGYPSFADTVDKVRPAVVNIYTTTRVRDRDRPPGPANHLVPEQRLSESLGSGFILDSAGKVLTNYHVVRDAAEIEVRLFDERRFEAKVVGEDPKTDIALLRLVDASDLPAIALGDSEELRVGDWVIAIGNPLGLTSTVTAGIASATGRRDIPISGDLRFQDFIQTDASIHPGSSGGPLVDLAGRVVGINTLVDASAQGIGFAIPVNMVKDLLPKLNEGGRVQRSWLGIYVDDVPGALRDELDLESEGGALVRGVVRDGPSQQAGLTPGDVVVAIEDHRVKDADDLTWVAGSFGVGETIDVEVVRGSEKLSLAITVGALE